MKKLNSNRSGNIDLVFRQLNDTFFERHLLMKDEARKSGKSILFDGKRYRISSLKRITNGFASELKIVIIILGRQST